MREVGKSFSVEMIGNGSLRVLPNFEDDIDDHHLLLLRVICGFPWLVNEHEGQTGEFIPFCDGLILDLGKLTMQFNA